MNLNITRNKRDFFIALMISFVMAKAAAQGVTGDTILIGQSAALSGPAEELGKEMKAGAEAYFKTVNDAGGINGRKIKLISLDDGYEPDRAKANTLTLSKYHFFGMSVLWAQKHFRKSWANRAAASKFRRLCLSHGQANQK